MLVAKLTEGAKKRRQQLEQHGGAASATRGLLAEPRGATPFVCGGMGGSTPLQPGRTEMRKNTILEQARNLDDLLKKYNQKISCVLGLKVDKEIIVKRILGRQTCSKCGLIFNKFFNPPSKNNYQCNLVHLKTRSDDNEQTIRNRFETFFKDTIPIINYYQKQNLMVDVNGMGEIQQIYKEIRQIIDSLDT